MKDESEGAVRGYRDLGAMSGEGQPCGTVPRTPSPSAEATQQILQMLSSEAAEEDLCVTQLLNEVTESITEISANKKPRKRARLRESVDWTEKGRQARARACDRRKKKRKATRCSQCHERKARR